MYGRSLAVVVLIVASAGLRAQTISASKKEPPPQTARQALLEMLLAKSPEGLQRHLPSAALAFVKTDTGAFPLQAAFEAIHELRQPGRELETFDDGPTLIRSKDPREQTIEVSVESELDGGDEVEMELGVHIYRSGRPVPLPFVPTVTCRMTMEEKYWRLSEAALHLRLPLGEPSFYEPFKEKGGAGVQAQEAAALRHIRMLSTAEVSYAAAYPGVGFTCSLSDLAGSDAGHPGPRAAMLIDDEAAGATVDGYVYVLSDCTGNPVSHFRVVGVPENPDSATRAFCSDESGQIQFADDGRAASCLTGGERLP